MEKKKKSIRVSLIFSRKKTTQRKCTFLELFSLLHCLEKNRKNRRFFRKFMKYLGSQKKVKTCKFFLAFLGFQEIQKIASKVALFQNYFLCYIVQDTFSKIGVFNLVKLFSLLYIYAHYFFSFFFILFLFFFWNPFFFHSKKNGIILFFRMQTCQLFFAFLLQDG